MTIAISKKRDELLLERLDRCAEPLLIVDDQGTVSAVNRAAERTMGQDAKTLLGQPVEVVLATMTERQGPAMGLQAVGRLACRSAHDLKNMIHCIVTFTDMARERVGNDVVAVMHMDRALAAAGRANALVEDMLAVARNRSRSVRASLQVAVIEAITLLRPTIPRTVELRHNFDGAIPAVAADSNQLHKIVTNLVSNAARAIGPASGLIDLRVDVVETDGAHRKEATKPTRGHVRLTVIDTGGGIPEPVIGHIFDEFFTTMPAGQGSGLGLSIVDEIVRSLGGWVDVQSTVGRGTRFQIYLPVADAAAASAPSS